MGMTDSRSARRTPILSAPANPAQSTLNRDPAQSQTQSQPEAPESIVQHQQEEHCKEIMVGLRVGQGGTSPGPKETNCLPAITKHTADETSSGYPAGCCSASARSQHTASHRSQNHIMNNKAVKVAPIPQQPKQNAAQFKVPRRSIGVVSGFGEVSV